MTLLEVEECSGEKKEENSVGWTDSNVVVERPLHTDIKSSSASRLCVGLTNLGNTCYMNAVLQLLFCVPSLTSLLAEDESLQRTGLGRELADLLKKASSGQYSQLSTVSLKHELGLTSSQYLGNQQHDSHELLIELLNHVHESLICKEKQTEEEGIPADSDFVVDTSMSSTSLTRREQNNLCAMNISPPNIPNIVDDNLNSLSITSQRGRVHENLPINLMEDRRIDATLSENIYHNIAASKPTLLEKEVSLLPEGQLINNVSNILPPTDTMEGEVEECGRSVDSNTPACPSNPHDLVWSKWIQQHSSVIVDTFFGQFVTHTTCCNCGHTTVNHAPYNHISLPLPHATDRHIVVTWIPKLERKPYRFLVTVTMYGAVSDLKSSLLSLLDLNITIANMTIVEVYQNRISIIHSDQTSLKHVNDSRSSVYAFERFIYDSDKKSNVMGDEKQQLQSEENFFTNNLDTETGEDRGGYDANIEVNIDVNKNCKHFKNKMSELFNPEAKIENKPKNEELSGALLDWSNCVICLEEFPPHLLCSHASCNMTMCAECYESYKRSDTTGGRCPVCQGEMGELQVAGNEGECIVRWSNTPLHVTYNTDVVAHPFLVELPSKIDGSSLLSFISSLLPAPITLQQSSRSNLASPNVPNQTSAKLSTDAILYTTDGAGVRTRVDEDSKYTIVSNTVLELALSTYPPALQEDLAHITDTESLKKLEHSLKPLELQDCLNAFVKSDELCAGSTWYCTECECEQSAMTSTSISHIPPYLILQLNRFNVLCTGPSRTEKIRCPVHIPRHNLDLSFITTGDNKHSTSYSLCGIIHHSGGIGGGHYTAQTLSELGTWRYYNDTSVTSRDPLTSDNGIPSNDSDARSAYVLLYRQDSETGIA